MGLKTRTPFSINRNNMGKTCLNKLTGNILVSCSIPSNGVKDIYLMHAEDVGLTVDTFDRISAATFAEGAKSYRVEGYKQNIQVTSTVRTMDASNKLDTTVMFKVPTSVNGITENFPFLKSLLTGRFYVLVVTGLSGFYLVGDVSPLECSGLDYDSNASGGFATVTLAAPDGSSGNYMRYVAQPVVSTIISKSA